MRFRRKNPGVLSQATGQMCAREILSFASPVLAIHQEKKKKDANYTFVVLCSVQSPGVSCFRAREMMEIWWRVSSQSVKAPWI